MRTQLVDGLLADLLYLQHEVIVAVFFRGSRGINTSGGFFAAGSLHETTALLFKIRPH